MKAYGSREVIGVYSLQPKDKNAVVCTFSSYVTSLTIINCLQSGCLEYGYMLDNYGTCAHSASWPNGLIIIIIITVHC
jgi:hypothetical protein